MVALYYSQGPQAHSPTMGLMTQTNSILEMSVLYNAVSISAPIFCSCEIGCNILYHALYHRGWECIGVNEFDLLYNFHIHVDSWYIKFTYQSSQIHLVRRDLHIVFIKDYFVLSIRVRHLLAQSCFIEYSFLLCAGLYLMRFVTLSPNSWLWSCLEVVN